MKHSKDYNEFMIGETKDWLCHEETFNSYLREGLLTISRAISTDLKTIDDAGEHKQLISATESIEKIKTFLRSLAGTKTSDSWRKARRAVAYYFRAHGLKSISKQINEITNPFPTRLRAKKPKKAMRMITVTPEIYSEIVSNRQEAGDTVALAMLRLCKELGIRPCEAPGLEVVDFDTSNMTMHVFVDGAKKTAIGDADSRQQRGIDRTLCVPVSMELIDAINVAHGLTASDIKTCQERIRRAGKKLWPNRVRRFCLYSLRYTMGSNLKAKYLNRRDGAKIVAAVMGHKCTSSMSEYGNKLSGSVSTGMPEPDEYTVSKVIDDRAKKYGIDGKFNPRSVLSDESVAKRDKKRQPSVRDILTRASSTHGHAQAREIASRGRSTYSKNTNDNSKITTK